MKQPFSVLWVHSGVVSLVDERSFQLDFLLLSVLCQVLHNVCLPIFAIYDVVISRACWTNCVVLGVSASLYSQQTLPRLASSIPLALYKQHTHATCTQHHVQCNLTVATPVTSLVLLCCHLIVAVSLPFKTISYLKKTPLLIAVFDKELDNTTAKYVDTSLKWHPSAMCTSWAVESWC